jgi:hypothetical protein
MKANLDSIKPLTYRVMLEFDADELECLKAYAHATANELPWRLLRTVVESITQIGIDRD